MDMGIGLCGMKLSSSTGLSHEVHLSEQIDSIHSSDAYLLCSISEQLEIKPKISISSFFLPPNRDFANRPAPV